MDIFAKQFQMPGSSRVCIYVLCATFLILILVIIARSLAASMKGGGGTAKMDEDDDKNVDLEMDKVDSLVEAFKGGAGNADDPSEDRKTSGQQQQPQGFQPIPGMMSPTMSPPPMLMPTPMMPATGSNPQSLTSPIMFPGNVQLST